MTSRLHKHTSGRVWVGRHFFEHAILSMLWHWTFCFSQSTPCLVPQCLFYICRAHGEAFTGKVSPSDNNAYIHSTLKTTGLLIEIDDMDEFLVKPQLVLAMLVELSNLPGNRGVGWTAPALWSEHTRHAVESADFVCLQSSGAMWSLHALTELVVVMAGDHSGHHACIHTEEWFACSPSIWSIWSPLHGSLQWTANSTAVLQVHIFGHATSDT